VQNLLPGRSFSTASIFVRLGIGIEEDALETNNGVSP